MISGGAASLDTEETSVPPNHARSYRNYLRSFSPQECDRTDAVLYRHYLPEQPRKWSAYRTCRTRAWFGVHTDTGQVTVISNACRQRWCPLCARKKAGVVYQNVRDWLAKCESPKLITLTLRHSHAPLDHQLRSLILFFRTLRKDKNWKRTYTGGVWFIQLTWNDHDNTWNPHLHVLADGGFLPQKLLSKLWLRITGVSKIVDVRKVRSGDTAAGYVSRYVTRPVQLAKIPPGTEPEVLGSFAARRTCGTFGAVTKLRLLSTPQHSLEHYKPLGSWTDILRLRSTCRDADMIVRSWQTGERLPDDIASEWLDQTMYDLRAPPTVDPPQPPQASFDWDDSPRWSFVPTSNLRR